MSGGTWNYKDVDEDSYTVAKLPAIIDALIKAFHAIDWAESCDTSRKDAEPEVYDILLELGDKLFGDIYRKEV